MTIRERLRALRYGGAVKRYHVVHTVGQETVAQHTFGVLALLTLLVPSDRLSGSLLLAGLYHDLSEQFTGDVPAHTKWAFPAVRHSVHEASRLLEDHHGWRVELSEDEQHALKLADLLDMVCYATEQRRLGNQHLIPVVNKVQQFVADHLKLSDHERAVYLAVIEEYFHDEPYTENMDGQQPTVSQ